MIVLVVIKSNQYLLSFSRHMRSYTYRLQNYAILDNLVLLGAQTTQKRLKRHKAQICHN